MLSDQRIWFGDDPLARIVRKVSIPASWLYELGWEVYRSLYKFGFKTAVSAHPRVLCIGNLTVGGSGKSPLTVFLAQELAKNGWQVVISCSGYGSPASEAALLAPSGPLKAREWGDEPSMIRWFLPDVPLVIGRRRVLAADIAYRAYPNSILLLDDGFQHLPLKKTVSILLDEAHPQNGHCLPAGPYREPRRNRSRADLVLPSEEFQITEQPLRFMFPLLSSDLAVDVENAREEFATSSVTVFCGIGRPEVFRGDLVKSGVKIGCIKQFSDHFAYNDLDFLESVPMGEWIVTTAKDWVKIQNLIGLEKWKWAVALKEVSIACANGSDEFIKWIIGRIL